MLEEVKKLNLNSLTNAQKQQMEKLKNDLEAQLNNIRQEGKWDEGVLDKLAEIQGTMEKLREEVAKGNQEKKKESEAAKSKSSYSPSGNTPAYTNAQDTVIEKKEEKVGAGTLAASKGTDAPSRKLSKERPVNRSPGFIASASVKTGVTTQAGVKAADFGMSVDRSMPDLSLL